MRSVAVANESLPSLPRRTVVLVNDDYAAREGEQAAVGPRAYEADAAVSDTARAVARALTNLGVEVEEVRVTSTLDGLLEQLAARRVSTVFNLVESLANDYGREWEVPALLGRHGLRFTGNGPRPLRLCRAKDKTRRLLQRAGVRVAPGFAVRDAAQLDPARLAQLCFPCFVKPARVDGSIGIDGGSICHDLPTLRARLAQLAHLPGPYLVETFLPGKEINVALFPEPHAGHVVATEIDFSDVPEGLPRIVTYDGKWNPQSPEYAAKSVPARLDPKLAREVEQLARGAFLALGGSGYGRVDMRLDADGAPCVIDVNPNNDLHPDAGLATAARSVGLGYDALIRGIVAWAEQEQRGA
ncbi:MAG: D-alanine--D-alanine ligase [Polyangiales bacterium]